MAKEICKEKECEACGAWFTPSRSNVKYCPGSVDTKSLRDVLIQRDMLSVLNFKSTPEGEKVFSELGITNLFGLHSGDGLYCKDIVQITYQNKVLYKRAKN